MLKRLRHTAFGLALLAAFSADARADGMRIAVVNIQRAVMSTEEGLRAAATLKKLFESRQQELKKKETDIEKQGAELQKQEKVISKEAFAKKRDELQRQAVEYQAVAMEASKDLDKKQRELTDPIVEKMLGVVKRIASTESYDVVVDSSPGMAGPWGAVAYARTDLDLTDKCIQMYNSGSAPAPAASGSAPRK